MGVERPPSRPGWARGVQLVRVARNSLHVVGDIENPMALTGASYRLLDWLTELCGEASWDGQLADAVFRGVPLAEATSVLRQLCRAGLVIDAAVPSVESRHELVLVGSSAFVEPMRGFGLAEDRLLPVPAGASRGDWIEAVDTAIDRADLVLLALHGVTAHAGEVQAAQMLGQAGRDCLVLGAGPHTARVGPLVRAPSNSCLNCEELVRCDLDPAWAAVSAAQATAVDVPAADPVLTALAAVEGMRQLQASAHGLTDCDAAILQTGPRGGPWWRRAVPAHPRCACWLSAVA